MIASNDFKKQWSDCGQNITAALKRVGESGYWILGSEVAEFEKSLALKFGFKFCLGVANGMDALEISLLSLDVRRGEPILTTPLSAFATTLAIMKVGARPVFIDVDHNGLINLNLVEEYLDKNPNVRFMLPVHLYGHSIDLDRLEKIKNKFNLKVIEDCAQSIGAKWKDRFTGMVGDVCATSFYPTKNLGCMGDGGAILTNNPDIYSKAKMIRDYGQSEKYLHKVYGLNSRLDELHAAILNSAFLPRLEGWLDRRFEIAKKYITSIKNTKIKILSGHEYSQSCWHLFPIVVNSDRQSCMDHFKQHGVSTGIHYPILIPDQPALINYKNFETFGSLSEAKRICENEVSLPIHPYLTDVEIDKVIQTANSW